MQRKTFNVFVTGFGPFPKDDSEQFEDNASHEVTKLLPSRLAAGSASNPSAVEINILNPTAGEGQYVKVEYGYIRDYCRRLHGETTDSGDGQGVDLYLHIGMAYGWEFVSVERCAYKQGMTSSWAKNGKGRKGYYVLPDNAGRTVEDLGPCPWDGVPIGLAPMVDVDGVVEGARALVGAKELFEGRKGIEIKQHPEAGTYCCGFIYYESLAHRWSKGREANVLFCHVPGQTDAGSLERARDGIVAVIAATVNQMVTKGEGKA
ncbi:Pyroglutamyl-peptidase 1 [Sphaceloma murrayae]|uniref:Pyroglutamyl-peptidase 1 n=1 Tax=Sphaceloma murrayae TaxID=2082308 RepID=A0A2K1QHF7_9PEZI|nr:Pyroglutamyl-peptidase 1 [Sphaceloma murrayae]